ncbi:MAG: hemerythrin family protein [Treponema sp.]|nr:hemerythrin family protein [Treponema sp.]
MSSDTHRLFLEHNVLIVWKPEYNLGIPIIDEHHRGIVSIVNSLHFGMQNNYVKEILSPIVDMMNDYSLIHFKIEEDFLEKIGFPNLKKHKELHQALFTNLKKLGRDSIFNKDSHEFMNFLKQWWINHIRVEDLAFKEHVFKK